MKTTIYVPDIECESCVKLLSKAFKKTEGINSYVVKDDTLEVDFDEHKIHTKDIMSLIEKLHFRASLHPFERKTIKERIAHFKENKHLYEIEMQIFSNAFWLFLILFVLEGLVYITVLKDIPDFLKNYGWWLLYINMTIATISMAVWHMYAYRIKVTCMVGMMIGMTLGMQTGLMLGAILGATNGFFIGATAGMIIGALIGAITGTCCGIMGIMEGMIAGIMGGTMGAMISVMLFSDHLLLFMPMYMLLNIIVVWGLSYMLYEEAIEGKKGIIKDPLDFTTVASFAIIVTFALLMIMLYGPKSILVTF